MPYDARRAVRLAGRLAAAASMIWLMAGCGTRHARDNSTNYYTALRLRALEAYTNPPAAAAPAPASTPAPAPAYVFPSALPAPTPAAPVAAPSQTAARVEAPPPPAREKMEAIRPGGNYVLRTGDPVVIFLRVYPQDQKIDATVDETGCISLPFIGKIKAAGISGSRLEDSIRTAYLDSKIYKYVSVNVSLPAKRFFVRGEVRQPGQFQLDTDMTVLQAISAAGGYNEFADPKDIKITRGDQTIKVNGKEIERNPEKDQMLAPGDVIDVGRKWY